MNKQTDLVDFIYEIRCPHCTFMVSVKKRIIGVHTKTSGATCIGSGREIAELDGQGRVIFQPCE